MKMLKKLFNLVLETLFPNRCLYCGEIVESGNHLCDYCYEMMPKCNLDKLCIYCGNNKKQCDCRRRVFHFNGCVSPFFNEDNVRKIMHRFKFRNKEYACDFFAQNMSLMVKQAYSHIKFDFICEVPMRKFQKIKRGYNQSEMLAQSISKILNIKHIPNVLGCNKKAKAQHNSNFRQRFENIKGVYYSNYKLNNKTILLVDDIKTTGATLDECAKQLLLSGADRVYCVTGLTTSKKKGNNNGNRYRN